MRGRHARRLRQLADADEVLRIEVDDALDQIVAVLASSAAGRLVADVMRHRRGARREDRQVGAALALQLQLVLFDALADLIVADASPRRAPACAGSFKCRELRVAKLLKRARAPSCSGRDSR